MIEMLEVRDAIAATFEDFELIIKPLDEATGLTVNEIIGDFLKMGIERPEETIETGEFAMTAAKRPIDTLAIWETGCLCFLYSELGGDLISHPRVPVSERPAAGAVLHRSLEEQRPSALGIATQPTKGALNS